MSAPIRVLELRCANQHGGGPDKTILLGATHFRKDQIAVTVCYIRLASDAQFTVGERARGLSLDYFEVSQRHPFDPAIWNAVSALADSRQIDIVHAHDYKTNLIAYLLYKSRGIVPISTMHGWDGRGLRLGAYYACERKLVSRFPRVISVSDHISKKLIESGVAAERIESMPNTVDAEHFRRMPEITETTRAKWDIPPDALVIGSVGRLEKVKRYDLLLEAVARLNSSRRKIVMLVGSGSEKQRLLDQAARLQGKVELRLVGYQENVKEMLHLFDIFVQSSDYEGTSNSVLEAMAMGVYVVATDVGGTSQIVRDGVNGRLVPRGSVPSLTEALNEALCLPGEALARVARARERVEREFSFSRRMRRLTAIYGELMLHR